MKVGDNVLCRCFALQAAGDTAASALQQAGSIHYDTIQYMFRTETPPQHIHLKVRIDNCGDTVL
jgi:hypothetical protein